MQSYFHHHRVEYRAYQLIVFFLLALKLSLSSDNMVNNHNHIHVSDQIYSGV